MYNDAPQTGCIAEKMPVSEEIMKSAAQLADRISAIADRTVSKLDPVMLASVPQPGGHDEGKALIRTYPPLFEALRAKFNLMNRALDQIEDAISRTEL